MQTWLKKTKHRADREPVPGRKPVGLELDRDGLGALRPKLGRRSLMKTAWSTAVACARGIEALLCWRDVWGLSADESRQR